MADDLTGWTPFVHGETALEFGSPYLFANPDTREIGMRGAHEPPPRATACIKLTALLEQARLALQETTHDR